MAMNPQCIQAVAQAIGKQPTAREIEDIQSRIQAQLTRLGNDPTVMAMSARDRLLEAAKRAADQYMAEKQNKLRLVALQAEVDLKNRKYIESEADKVDALGRLVATSHDMQSTVQSAESVSKAINQQAGAKVLPLLEATHQKLGGLLGEDGITSRIIDELSGKDTGNAEIKKAAKAWIETTTWLKDRFNRAGGMIGELESWIMPQIHDALRISKVGRDEWIKDVKDIINRDAYLNEKGERMTDGEMDTFLSEVYRTVSTRGANKTVRAFEQGQQLPPRGAGSRSNYNSQSRLLHFKDGKSSFDYMQKYGPDGGSYAVMMDYLRHMSDQIALVETFGPNADYAFNNLLRYAKDKDIDNGRSGNKIQTDANNVEKYYKLVANQMPLVSPGVAKVANTIKSLNRIMLGSSYISSITDHGIMRMVAHSRGLGFWNPPELQRFINTTMNPLNSAEKRAFNQAGIGLQIFLNDVSRFGSDGAGMSSVDKFSNLIVRLGAMPKATEARRRAYGGFMTSTVGRVVKDNASLSAMNASDARIIKGAGITDADYSIWKIAKQEDWTADLGFKADTMLTIESIYSIADADIGKAIGSASKRDIDSARDTAATRLLGLVMDETHTAVLEPSVRDRATLDIGERGTVVGEIIRSATQFKTFPIAFWNRHIMQRARSYDGKLGALQYRASIVAASTALGYVAMQMVNLRDGKDLQDPLDDKVILQALLKGGSLSIYGDFILSTPSLSQPSFYTALAGPTIQNADKALRTIKSAATGDFDKAASSALNLSNSYNPLHTLLWTRPLYDHAILHDLQEAASPGYLDRVRDRAYKEFGQENWWEMGDPLPSRLPQFAEGGEK